jgi:hypothetical protein
VDNPNEALRPGTLARMTDNVKDQLANLRLRSQSDVQHMWELVMQPLGFTSSSLWVTFYDDRRAPRPMLMEVAEHPGVPSETEVARLVAVLGDVVHGEPDLVGVAFLITRPGGGTLLQSDRLLSARLLAAARTAGLPCQPVHVANDVAVLTVAPDDLAA